QHADPQHQPAHKNQNNPKGPMPSMAPPALQLKASGGDDAIQLQGEKVGPLGLICQGEGTVNGDEVNVSKTKGGASIGTLTNGSEVHVVPDNGLGKGEFYFVYAPVNYEKGGSGKEYVWVKSSAITLNKPDEKAPDPKPKTPTDEVTEEEEKETWRSSGNLRGNPPVRSEDPHNINVIEDEAEYNQLLTLARKSLKKLTARADAMYGKATTLGIEHDSVLDNRFWFTKVYQFVTEGELKYIESNQFYYPSYVLRSVIYFEKVYADNMDAADTGDVEAHWKKAFEKTSEKDTDWYVDFLDGIQCLVQSMLAHIRFDLPRCEAWVFNSYYSHLPGVKIQDFKEDFMSMAGIFDDAGDRMNAVIYEYASWYFGKWMMSITPKMMEQIVMSYYHDADMGAERADAWKRAEMLVDDGLAGDDPYKITGDTISGDVTTDDNESNIGKLDEGMAPSMDDNSPLFDDNDARAALKNATQTEIQSWSVGKRIRMMVGMLTGSTTNDDENSILKLMENSKDALVTIVDGANAWNLLFAMDGAQYTTARQLLLDHYYAKTGEGTLINLLKKCCVGETAEWEESMIA
ncbi:MAG: DUF5995 family protein, partial [Bacteroidota bacterium]